MNHTALIASLSFLALTACSPSSSSTIGPEGGTVESQGARLTIPAGALQAPVEISLLPVDDSAGASNSVSLEPRGLRLSRPATLALSRASSDDSLHKIIRIDDSGLRAQRGWRELESEHGREVEGLVDDFSTYGVARSHERCDDRGDDDGDGLIDCADPACAAAPACGGTAACVTDDTCPCGSDCVAGACTPPGKACTTDSDCQAGERCREESSHGQLCGFAACHVSDDSWDDSTGGGGSGRDHPEDD